MSNEHLPGAVPWPAELAQRWRAAGYWTGQTFADMLDEQADRNGDRVAIVEGSGRTTYRQLRERARSLAAGLYRLGLRREDRVVVQLGNVTGFFEVCFALYTIGALPVFALPAHRASELGQFIGHSQARALIIAERNGREDLRATAEHLREQAARPLHVLVAGSAAGHDGLLELSEHYLPGAHAERLLADVPRPAADEVAFLQLSGGSTGLPKLIPRTHDEYLYTLRESARICGLDAQTRYLAVLPVAHNYPMSSPGCFGVFTVGGQVVLADGGEPDEAFGLIAEEQVTIAALVPPLALVWAAADRRGRDLSSLQVVQVGGAPFAPSAARRVTAAFPDATLQQVFGMAEGLVCYTRLDDPAERIWHTQGRPISPDDELLIVDDADEPVPPGEPGHLLTRGPYTIGGYYRAEAHNRAAFTADGYYRTGDIVSVDPSGYVRVLGRAKDQINRGGEKIAIEEVENLLLAHPDVHDAALVGMPDDLLGERACAFLVPRPDADLTRRTVLAYLRGRGVAAFKIPDRVVVVDAFPETGVGKTSKRELRALIREQLLTTSSRSNT